MISKIILAAVCAIAVFSISPVFGELAPFVDETKNPQSYVDRYHNEPSYKEWFDSNYPQYDSIYEAVGLQEPIPTWIKNSALWYGQGELKDNEFFNMIQFLLDRNIIKTPNTDNSGDSQDRVSALELELSELKSSTVRDIQSAYDDGYRDGSNSVNNTGDYDTGYDAGYDKGYKVGFDEGHNAGYSSLSNSDDYRIGYNKGYDEGYDAGSYSVSNTVSNADDYKVVYDKGYEAGRQVGYDEGSDSGYDKGRDVGYDKGYDEGYDEGHENGYDEGYKYGDNEGYDKGYDKGYDEGYKHGYEARWNSSP